MGLAGLTIAFLILLSGAVAWWWVRFGEHTRWMDLPRHVGEFCGYSARGGILEIRHMRSGRTIQFASIDEGAEGRSTFEFAFPEMSRSAGFFEELISKLEAAGFACTVEEAPTRNAPVRRFVSVVSSGTKDELVDQTRRLLDILGPFLEAKPEDPAKLRFRGAVRASAIEQLRTSSMH